MTDTSTEAVEPFLILKRGYYYRPGSSGYTAIKAEAGRYSLDETAVRFPKENDSGLSYVAESEAPVFSPACDPITKMQYQNKELQALVSELEDSKAALIRERTNLIETKRQQIDDLKNDLRTSRNDAVKSAALMGYTVCKLVGHKTLGDAVDEAITALIEAQ